MKKKVLLYIDIGTAKTAKQIGLNLSKVSENALKSAVRRLEGTNGNIGCGKAASCSENEASECEGWDSNTRRPSPEDLRSIAPLDYHLSRSDLISWLQQIRGLRAGTIKQ